MSFLHRTRFWALLPSSVQLSPLSFTSHSKSLLQLFLGRPHFLFPWGISMKEHAAWCYLLASGECGLSSPTSSFLLVAQLALLPPIPTYRGSLVILSFQQMPRILLRQLLTNLCTLLCILFIFLQVSDPYIARAEQSSHLI